MKRRDRETNPQHKPYRAFSLAPKPTFVSCHATNIRSRQGSAAPNYLTRKHFGSLTARAGHRRRASTETKAALSRRRRASHPVRAAGTPATAGCANHLAGAKTSCGCALPDPTLFFNAASKPQSPVGKRPRLETSHPRDGKPGCPSRGKRHFAAMDDGCSPREIAPCAIETAGSEPGLAGLPGKGGASPRRLCYARAYA
jgi:hypothetical protein